MSEIVAEPSTQKISPGWLAVAWLGGAVLVPMSLYVVANALSRKLLSSPFPYSIEIVQYWFMPPLVCLGFVVAELRRQHVSADLLFNRFPLLGRKWLTVGSSVLSLVVMAALATYTFLEALHAARIGLVAGSSPLPIWPVYFLLPAAFATVAVILAVAAVRAARSPRESFDEVDVVLLAEPETPGAPDAEADATTSERGA